MAEPDKKTMKWRSKFAGQKITYAADAPPDAEAKKAFKYGIAGAAATAAAVLLYFVVAWWLGLIVWLIGLPFVGLAAFRGKFEGDVIDAGRAPSLGRRPARLGMLLGLGSAAISVLFLLGLLVYALLPGPSVGGQYGDADKTFAEYMKAVHADDYDAYIKCLAPAFQESQTQATFDALKKRRASQTVTLSTVEYSDGGTTSVDAKRADVIVRCSDPTSGDVDVRMTMTREEDGWKVSSSDL